jgi:hypothetical protein
MNKQNSGRINFNFDLEQQKRFNLILDETKRLYPELVVNDIDKERIKVLIAHSVINNDKMPEQLQGPKEENEFNEIKD